MDEVPTVKSIKLLKTTEYFSITDLISIWQ